jgi:hypothetical protein
MEKKWLWRLIRKGKCKRGTIRFLPIDDANLVRKHSAINHLMSAVCGVWVNGADPEASGGSLLLRRVGGHGQANPGDYGSAYL